MGNGNSILEESYKNYENIGEQHSPAYGDFRLLQNKFNMHQLANKKLVTDKKSEIFNIHRTANRYEKSRNPYVVKGKAYLKNSESICSQFFKLSMFFEYYDQNLATLKSMDKSYVHSNHGSEKLNDSFDLMFSRDFSEQDYLHIIFCCASALEFIQEEGRYHGSINPWTILVSPENYKLADHMLINGTNGFTELLTNSKSKVYLAPELFECLKRGDIDESISMQKADIFSLGFTILSLSKGIRPEVFYNFGNFNFNKDLMETHLQTMSYSFTKEFCQLLAKMLDLNPRRRYSASEVIDYIERTYNKDEFGKISYSRNDNSNSNMNFPSKEDTIRENMLLKNLPNENQPEQSVLRPVTILPIEQSVEPTIPSKNRNPDLDNKLRMYYYPPEPVDNSRKMEVNPSTINKNQYIDGLPLQNRPLKYPLYVKNDFATTKRKSNLNELKSELNDLDNKLNSLMSRSSRAYSNSNHQIKYF